MSNILDVQNLTIHYLTEDSIVRAVNDVSFSIADGETLGLVGETGAGKTTTALGVMRLIPSPPGKIVSGRIMYYGEDLLQKPMSHMREIRGGEISMIFQDPMTALNPVLRVSEQIAEVIRHHGHGALESEKLALEMLEKVGIPASRGRDYPHQFSGGMKQRVVIAMALACRPKLLLADEPTTALDVTIQAQILDMMRELKNELGTSMLLITHDLGVVAETCDSVAVMYAGEIVEYGSLEDIFDHTLHPYTVSLFGALPSLEKKLDRLQAIAGLMPDPANLPTGCPFHPRCPRADAQCAACVPEYREITPGHFVRCRKAEKEAI